MPKKNRRIRKKRPGQVVGCYAFKDTDADILDWWFRMPETKRSEGLRDALRTSFAVQDGAASTDARIETLMGMVAQLAREVAELRREIRQGVRLDKALPDFVPADPRYAGSVLRQQW